ncbi:MAG TPA: LLM class flavin-dependent oxidoreductase [Chloroflexota bacterium]|jgi:alkanesulfonate monooxygenase SsuD/methylene tetrahydromethanopterin reductase-like flavin-dependent oxidoreductase (luciferase family)
MADTRLVDAPAPTGGGALPVGIFDYVDLGQAERMADVYEQRLRMLEYADQAGYYCYHLAEHHSTPLSLVPSPNVFLAAAAQRTRRIRLGTLVYLLPFYNPLRLIDEICMVDQLSRGRLEIGLGRGIQPWECKGYNLDPQDTRSLFRESLDVLLQGLSTGVVNYQGEHLTFHDVPVTMRPYQQPYPPMWYPTSVSDAEWMAQHSFNTISGALFIPVRAIPDKVSAYWQVQRAHAHEPGRINGHEPNPKFGFACLIYVGETDAEALATARAAYPAFYDSFSWLFRLRGDPYVARLQGFDGLLEPGMVLVGSPATTRARLQETMDLIGGNYFAGIFAWGTLGEERILASMQRFAEQVMPALRVPARVG